MLLGASLGGRDAIGAGAAAAAAPAAVTGCEAGGPASPAGTGVRQAAGTCGGGGDGRECRAVRARATGARHKAGGRTVWPAARLAAVVGKKERAWE